MFVSSPLATTQRTYHRGCVLTSTACCPRKLWVWWSVVFGPHSFDLMSLDSNCQRDLSGRLLPHFSPWATPVSQGIIVFAQPIPLGHNIYVFASFVLVGPLLRYFVDQDFRGAFTLVVPDLRPRRFWWVLLRAVPVDRLLLGRKGDGTALLFPSRSAPVWSLRTLQWDLWAYRCVL